MSKKTERDVILGVLENNLGYEPGEKVLIVTQEHDGGLSCPLKSKFEKSWAVAKLFYDVCKGNGIPCTLFGYMAENNGSGFEPPPSLPEELLKAEADIILLPTAYSLTHTSFVKDLQSHGLRIASMPGCSMHLFQPGGPVDVDYNEIARKTKIIADSVRQSDYLRITGPGTSIVVEVDKERVYEDSGILRVKPSIGNIPGGEVSMFPAKASGFITVPEGLGGPFQLEYPVRFMLEGGIITEILPSQPSTVSEDYVRSEIQPLFGENSLSVVELGIATNSFIEIGDIEKYGWSCLFAEKVGGTAHIGTGRSLVNPHNGAFTHLDWIFYYYKLEYLPAIALPPLS